MAELDDETYERIKELCAQGDALVADEKHAEALASYQRAWDLLGEPRDNPETAIWIAVAMGDVHFHDRRYSDAKGLFAIALMFGAGDNPFVHLRIGECYFELGDMTRAADELTRAYALDGRRVFEEQDPKYLAFLATVIKPPAGRDEL